MNPFNEMVLLPKDEYNRLTSQALHGSAPSMQKELDLLHSNNSNLPIDQKNKLEQEIITKYTDNCKSLINQDQEQTASDAKTIVLDDDDSVILRHLDNFRKTNKWRAKEMYLHLKSFKPQWNNMGQLFNAQSKELIPRSNVIDLINYVTSSQITGMKTPPAGLQEFIKLLLESNTPETYFSTPGINRMAKFVKNNDKNEENDEEEEEVDKHPTKRHKTDDYQWDSLS